MLLGLRRVKEAMGKFSELFHDNPEMLPQLMMSAGIRALAHDYSAIADTMLSFVLAHTEEGSPEFPNRNMVYAYLAMAKYNMSDLDGTLKYLKIACRETPELIHRLFSDFLPDTLQPADYYDHLVALVKRHLGRS